MSSSFMMGKGLRRALVMGRKLEMVDVERCEVHKKKIVSGNGAGREG